MIQEKLIFVDLYGNSNKFWHAAVEGSQLLLEWGRVGDNAQKKLLTFGSEALAERELERRRRAKLNNGYTVQQTFEEIKTGNIAWVAKLQIEHNNDKETEKLIDFLVERNIHAIEGSTSIRLEAGKLTTPLGPVTLKGLDQAELLLTQMSNKWAVDKSNSFADLVNQYLRIVPRQIGRTKTDPRDLFGTAAQIEQEQAMLDSLRAVVRDIEQRVGTEGPPVFQAKLSLIDRNSLHFSHINGFFELGKNSMHQSYRMRLKRAWEMSIDQMSNEFVASLGNVKELWHGTRDANLLSILKNGYVISKSGANGRMYGDGVYFSDQSTKSLNYATGYWSGSGSYRCFMLLNDVAMGREYMTTRSFSGTAPKGYDSTFAKAGVSGVRNNEFIVYNTQQIKPKFLCEFE